MRKNAKQAKQEQAKQQSVSTVTIRSLKELDKAFAKERASMVAKLEQAQNEAKAKAKIVAEPVRMAKLQFEKVKNESHQIVLNLLKQGQLTQAQIAEATGYTQGRISQIKHEYSEL